MCPLVHSGPPPHCPQKRLLICELHDDVLSKQQCGQQTHSASLREAVRDHDKKV